MYHGFTKVPTSCLIELFRVKQRFGFLIRGNLTCPLWPLSNGSSGYSLGLTALIASAAAMVVGHMESKGKSKGSGKVEAFSGAGALGQTIMLLFFAVVSFMAQCLILAPTASFTMFPLNFS